MKKRIVVLLISALCISAVACGDSESVTMTEMQSGNGSQNQQDTEQKEQVDNQDNSQNAGQQNNQQDTMQNQNNNETIQSQPQAPSTQTASGRYQGLEASATASSADCVTLKFTNNSDRGYSIGWVGGGTVTMVTTEGQYFYTIARSMSIPSGSSCTETCYFDNAKGNIVSISISEVNKLSSSGLPESMTASTLTIEF